MAYFLDLDEVKKDFINNVNKANGIAKQYKELDIKSSDTGMKKVGVIDEFDDIYSYSGVIKKVPLFKDLFMIDDVYIDEYFHQYIIDYLTSSGVQHLVPYKEVLTRIIYSFMEVKHFQIINNYWLLDWDSEAILAKMAFDSNGLFGTDYPLMKYSIFNDLFFTNLYSVFTSLVGSHYQRSNDKLTDFDYTCSYWYMERVETGLAKCVSNGGVELSPMKLKNIIEILESDYNKQ